MHWIGWLRSEVTQVTNHCYVNNVQACRDVGMYSVLLPALSAAKISSRRGVR